jgi:hypothetical protein
LVLTNAVFLMCCSRLFGQNPQLRLPSLRGFPTVLFSSVLWSGDPSYYSIAIDSSGAATYQSAPESLASTGVPFTIEFQVSDRTRRIAFNLAERLNFFAGTTDGPTVSADRNSIRTLAYFDGKVKNQFSFSNTSDPDIEEMTSVFEELSETFEFGRRLAYFQQHDKRGLGPQLQHMQKQAERHQLRELHALVSVLRVVADDRSLDATARKQAETLLRMAQDSH